MIELQKMMQKSRSHLVPGGVPVGLKAYHSAYLRMQSAQPKNTLNNGTRSPKLHWPLIRRFIGEAGFLFCQIIGETYPACLKRLWQGLCQLAYVCETHRKYVCLYHQLLGQSS